MGFVSILQRTAANVLDNLAAKGERAVKFAEQRGGNPEKAEEFAFRASEARWKAQELRERAEQNEERERFEQECEISEDYSDERGLPSLDELIRVLCAEMSIDEEDITLNSSLIDDLCIGSDVAAMAVTERLGIDIPEEDSEGFITVGDVYEYLLSRANTDEK